MKPVDLIAGALADGVTLRLVGGKLKVIGDTAAVNRWLSVIRQHKPEMIDALKVGAGDTATDPIAPAEARMGKVIARLHGDPGLRYAVEAHIDADPEAVILSLAIRGKAACELRVPRDKYDPFLLLDLIERHSGKVH